MINGFVTRVGQPQQTSVQKERPSSRTTMPWSIVLILTQEHQSKFCRGQSAGVYVVPISVMMLVWCYLVLRRAGRFGLRLRLASGAVRLRVHHRAVDNRPRRSR